MKAYHPRVKEHKDPYQHEYYVEHRDHLLELRRRWAAKNPQPSTDRSEYQSAYYKKHKKAILKKAKDRYKNRKEGI